MLIEIYQTSEWKNTTISYFKYKNFDGVIVSFKNDICLTPLNYRCRDFINLFSSYSKNIYSKVCDLDEAFEILVKYSDTELCHKGKEIQYSYELEEILKYLIKKFCNKIDINEFEPTKEISMLSIITKVVEELNNE